MFKCPSCGGEKFINSCGPTGLIRTCRNPICGGRLDLPRYSWIERDDEYHLKEVIEAAQARASQPAPEPVQEAEEEPQADVPGEEEKPVQRGPGRPKKA